MITVAPSMLASNFRNLQDEVEALMQADADCLHFDIMDGEFVENITFGPMLMKHLRELTDLPFNAHLMVNNPERQIGPCAEAGADHILFQVEADDRPVRLLDTIHELGCKAGVVYNPATPLEGVDAILPEAEMVLVMSVEPGAGGQAFMPVALDRIRTLRKMIDEAGLETQIAVDGGINTETAPRVIAAGVDFIVSGSWLFNHERGYGGAIEELRQMYRDYAQTTNAID